MKVICTCALASVLETMEFTVDAMIREYQEYNQIWEAEDGEVLQCQRETGNRHDLYAVATVKNDVVVGHVPRIILSLCSIFIRHGGSITCTVTAGCRYSADLVQGDVNSLQDDLYYG